jgi:hypothetical protein
MTPVALPFAVLEDLGGGAGDVGLAIAAGSGMQVLVQLFGGAFADRGSAVIGVSFALHWPAAVGLVPLVAPRDALQPANALLSLAHSTALGLGAAAGGLLAARFGAGAALAVDAGTFATSALLVAGARARPQARCAAASLWAELRAGWSEFVAQRWLWTIVLAGAPLTLGLALVTIVLPTAAVLLVPEVRHLRNAK